MREKAAFYKKLFSIVLPLALQYLMSAIVSASDAVMLGFLNQDSLSAVSLATQVQFVLNLFYVALTIGTTILAAQYWGKGNIPSVEKTLGIATRFSMLISFLFFASALGCPSLLMRIFTNEATLIQLGIPYLRIVSFSYLLMGFTQIYLCIMKNSGRSLRSTIYSSAAMVLNIILNAVLIFGLAGFPALGIEGAAYATLIARVAETALVLMENGRKVPVKVHLSYIIKAEKTLQKDFIRYTLPMLLNELAWGCGFTMFSVIMGHLGNDAVAANSVANIVKNIIACVCLGIGTGSGIMVGNELGSGNMERYGRHHSAVHTADHAAHLHAERNRLRLSQSNAAGLFLLYHRKIHQLHCDCRYFPRRQRHTVRTDLRHCDNVVRCGSCRTDSGICPEAACSRGLFSAEYRRNHQIAGGLLVL